MRNEFDVVTTAGRLKTNRTADDHMRRRGFAVYLHDAWFWFPALEPAYAFARAGRMSEQVGSIGMQEATIEVKFDRRAGRDVRTLTLLRNSDSLSEARGREKELLHSFADGVAAASAHWPVRR